MRIALAILASFVVSAAHAEKLFTPVYIKQTTGIGPEGGQSAH